MSVTIIFNTQYFVFTAAAMPFFIYTISTKIPKSLGSVVDNDTNLVNIN